MKYVINLAADLEEILVEGLQSYVYDDVRFKDIFSKFGGVRISGTHPFAYLLEAQLSNKKIQTGLFPSLTLIIDNDQKCPEVNVATNKRAIKITSAELDDIDNRRDIYVVSDKDMEALRELTANDQFVWAGGMSQKRKADMVLEVWSRNPKIKNRLYDIAMNYLVGSGRFALREDYNNIIIVEDSISGQKSGNYNYDFGYTLYGGFIRFSVDYVIAQYVADTEVQSIADIVHQYTEVKNSE